MKKKNSIKIQSTFSNGNSISHKANCGCDDNCTCNKEVQSYSKKHIANASMSVVGFDSIKDYSDTAFAPTSGKFLFFASVIGGLSSFITSYIYDSAPAVYFLLAMIALDAVTGIVNALRKGIFSSKRLPRILGIMVSYTLILGMSWNLAKYTPELATLPGLVYFGFVSVLGVSVIENLSEMGLIPKSVSDKFMSIVKKKD